MIQVLGGHLISLLWTFVVLVAAAGLGLLNLLVCVALLRDRVKKQEQWVFSLRKLLFFCLVTAISASPWYLRNWIVTGNPVWPMFYPILGGKGWNMAAYEAGLRELQTI